jgi:hypothetical protein
MGSCWNPGSIDDFEGIEQAISMEVVLLLSAHGELSELYFCEHSSPAPHGVGGVRASISLLEHLFDPELYWSNTGLCIILLLEYPLLLAAPSAERNTRFVDDVVFALGEKPSFFGRFFPMSASTAC